MSEQRLAIIGAGSVRCTPAVIASLATYFGERPLEIRMWDADIERLDLFDRFARLCFARTYNSHHLISTAELREALDEADYVILQIGETCARKFLREYRHRGAAQLDPEAMIAQAIEEIIPLIPSGACVLSLQRDNIEIPREAYSHVPWPNEPTEEERRALPHQIMRWLRGEEETHAILVEFEHSPIRAWLDSPEATLA